MTGSQQYLLKKRSQKNPYLDWLSDFAYERLGCRRFESQPEENVLSGKNITSPIEKRTFSELLEVGVQHSSGSTLLILMDAVRLEVMRLEQPYAHQKMMEYMNEHDQE